MGSINEPGVLSAIKVPKLPAQPPPLSHMRELSLHWAAQKVLYTPPALAGRVADPHWPHPCEVANSVGIFRELSWLTRGDRKATGLRPARQDSV